MDTALSDNQLLLRSWYFEKLSKQTSQIKRITRNLKFNLFFGLVPFFIFLVLYALNSGNLSDSDSSEALLISFIPLILPVIVYLVLGSSKKELERNIDSIVYTCPILLREEYPDLYEICDFVNDTMGRQVNYTILYAKRDDYFPSIVQIGPVKYLLFPRNFIKLVYTKPQYAKAILFHEFAHVVQDDCNNYLFNIIFTRNMKNIGILYLFATIIAIVLMGKLAISIVTITTLGAYWGLRGARIESEVLADTNVLIYYDGIYLIGALKDYAKEDESNVSHFSPAIRIKLILEKMKEYHLEERLQNLRETDPQADGERQIAKESCTKVNDAKTDDAKEVAAYVYNNLVTISELYRLIRTQKRTFAFTTNKQIPEMLRQLAPDRKASQTLYEGYWRQFKADLITDLLSISTRYEAMAFYVAPLVENGFCDREYPYAIAKTALPHNETS